MLERSNSARCGGGYAPTGEVRNGLLGRLLANGTPILAKTLLKERLRFPIWSQRTALGISDGVGAAT